MGVTRGDIVLAGLDPTLGSEVNKVRPCLVVSPDSLNRRLPTIVIVPLTTQRRRYPMRVDCMVSGRASQAMPEQIRTISYDRVVRRLGHDETLTEQVLDRLQELFVL